jgi:hypothetical protein
MPSSCRIWANFFGSARRRSAIIVRNSASPASVKTSRGRAAAPGLEHEAFGHSRKRREDHIGFVANIGPLAQREPRDWHSLRLGHALHIARYEQQVAPPHRLDSRSAVSADTLDDGPAKLVIQGDCRAGMDLLNGHFYAVCYVIEVIKRRQRNGSCAGLHRLQPLAA